MVERLLASHAKGPPIASTVRVMFLGTSQTWGEGASAQNRITSEVVCRLLDRRLAAAGARAECINAGVRASDSGRMLGAYRDHLMALKPDVLVAIFGFNDVDRPALHRNLSDLVAANRQTRIRTLLVAEPCSFRWGISRDNQQKMPALAARLGVPLAEPQQALDRNLDHGFLWWDGAHLTDAGQALLAQELVDGGLGKLVDEALASRRAAAPVDPAAPAAVQ